MAINVTIKSNAALVKRATQEAIDRALEACGLYAEAAAKLEIERPKPHKNGEIRPNVDTGRLVNSITHTKADDMTEVVGTNVEYAPYVEYGTAKTLAYPFLKPALEKNIEKYKAIIEKYLRGNA